MALPAACARTHIAGDGGALFGEYLAGVQAAADNDLEAAAIFFGSALERDPDNVMVLERVLLFAVASGRNEEVARHARGLLETRGHNAFALFSSGAAWFAAGRYREAADQMAAVARPSWSGPAAALAEPWAEQGAGNEERARVLMSLAARHVSSRPLLMFHTALLSDAQGRIAEADGAYQRLGVMLEERNGGRWPPRVAVAYGAFLQRRGRVDVARALYHKVLAGGVEHPDVAAALATLGEPAPVLTPRRAVAEAMFALAEEASALARGDEPILFTRFALLLSPDMDAARLFLALQYERNQRWSEAAALYGEVVEGSPWRSYAVRRQAAALGRDGETEQALEMLAALAEANPGDYRFPEALGNMHSLHERWEDAARAYSRAIALVAHPTRAQWPLFYRRGAAYERLGQWPLAEADLRRAVRLSGGHPQALNYLGYSWAEQQRNLDQALSMIEQAVAASPGDGHIVDSLGWVYYRLGVYEEAVRHLERAAELEPSEPVVNDHLGDALWRVRRNREARFQWRRALDLEKDPERRARIEFKILNGLVAGGNL